MPNDTESNGRTVKVNLRSQEWRNGVKASAEEYKNKAIEALTNIDKDE